VALISGEAQVLGVAAVGNVIGKQTCTDAVLAAPQTVGLMLMFAMEAASRDTLDNASNEGLGYLCNNGSLALGDHDGMPAYVAGPMAALCKQMAAFRAEGCPNLESGLQLLRGEVVRLALGTPERSVTRNHIIEAGRKLEQAAEAVRDHGIGAEGWPALHAQVRNLVELAEADILFASPEADAVLQQMKQPATPKAKACKSKQSLTNGMQMAGADEAILPVYAALVYTLAFPFMQSRTAQGRGASDFMAGIAEQYPRLMNKSKPDTGTPPVMVLAEAILMKCAIEMNHGELLKDLLEKARAGGTPDPGATTTIKNFKKFKEHVARVHSKIGLVLAQKNPNDDIATPAAVRALPAAFTPSTAGPRSPSPPPRAGRTRPPPAAGRAHLGPHASPTPPTPQKDGAILFNQLFGTVAKLRDAPANRIQFLNCCMLYFNIGKLVTNKARHFQATVAAPTDDGWKLGTGHDIYLHVNTGFLRLVAQVYIGLVYVMLPATAERTRPMQAARLAEVCTRRERVCPARTVSEGGCVPAQIFQPFEVPLGVVGGDAPPLAHGAKALARWPGMTNEKVLRLVYGNRDLAFRVVESLLRLFRCASSPPTR
jgi:hypothetical protein